MNCNVLNLLLSVGVSVHPDAALSEGEPEGLDGPALPPGAERAQPVSGYLPPDRRGCRLPAQQRAHAQRPQGEHAHYILSSVQTNKGEPSSVFTSETKGKQSGYSSKY